MARAARRAATSTASSYEGLYCVGLRAVLRRPTSSSTAAAPSTAPPEPVAEENWFFRLSRYARPLRDAHRVGPAARSSRRRAATRCSRSSRRACATSASRARARARRGWGIPVPGDPTRSSTCGSTRWATTSPRSATAHDGADYRRWWRGADERVHVIGKGDPALPRRLLAGDAAVGRPAAARPTILVHDYLTVDGAKISKSLGNAVDPVALVDRVRHRRAALVAAARGAARRRRRLHRRARSSRPRTATSPTASATSSARTQGPSAAPASAAGRGRRARGAGALRARSTRCRARSTPRSIASTSPHAVVDPRGHRPRPTATSRPHAPWEPRDHWSWIDTHGSISDRWSRPSTSSATSWRRSCPTSRPWCRAGANRCSAGWSYPRSRSSRRASSSRSSRSCTCCTEHAHVVDVGPARFARHRHDARRGLLEVHDAIPQREQRAMTRMERQLGRRHEAVVDTRSRTTADPTTRSRTRRPEHRACGRGAPRRRPDPPLDADAGTAAPRPTARSASAAGRPVRAGASGRRSPRPTPGRRRAQRPGHHGERSDARRRFPEAPLGSNGNDDRTRERAAAARRTAPSRGSRSRWR